MEPSETNQDRKLVGYRLPKDIRDRLEELAEEHNRSINSELITCLQEYFSINQILKDTNMRDILTSLASMPRNFEDSKLTKVELKKFFNTYVDVMINLEEKKHKRKS